MADKIQLKVEKESKAYKPIFIGIEQHQRLLDIKNETGIPLKKLTNMFIDFAIDNLEIIEESEE